MVWIASNLDCIKRESITKHRNNRKDYWKRTRKTVFPSIVRFEGKYLAWIVSLLFFSTLCTLSLISSSFSSTQFLLKFFLHPLVFIARGCGCISIPEYTPSLLECFVVNFLSCSISRQSSLSPTLFPLQRIRALHTMIFYTMRQVGTFWYIYIYKYICPIHIGIVRRVVPSTNMFNMMLEYRFFAILSSYAILSNISMLVNCCIFPTGSNYGVVTCNVHIQGGVDNIH